MASPSYGVDVVALALVVLAAAIALLASQIMPHLADLMMPPALGGAHDRSIAHGIVNQATTVMIRARAAITMIAHSVTQIANGTRRFRCMFDIRTLLSRLETRRSTG